MVKYGNAKDDDDDDKEDDEEYVMEIIPPPSIPQCQVSQMYQYGEREGNGTISGRESGAGDKIFGSMQASIQGERESRRQSFG